MSAAGVGKLYQVTAAKSFFESSDKLEHFNLQIVYNHRI
jgi:hypothetical protein